MKQHKKKSDWMIDEIIDLKEKIDELVKLGILQRWRDMGYTSKKKGVMGGKECISGTRLTVKNLLQL